MKRLSAVVLAWALPTLAQAEIIKCRFTEPFVTTVYSTTQSTLTIGYETEAREDTFRNVSFQILKAGLFELWDADRRPIHRLELSGKGSDAMSDREYPYDVLWIGKGLRGGCTSTHLSAKP